MVILTFDIEEWYLEKKHYGDNREKYHKYDYYLDEILNVLETHGFKGTFFCVGGMATDFPNVVKKIADYGHEIGCHSFKHSWLNKMSKDEVLMDTRTSVDAIEQCIGKKVKSYRAPAFTIGQDNKWVFEILAQCGIERDASIFPIKRDFGGFDQFGIKCPSIVSHNQTQIKEFPISTTMFMGHEIAYSGGGYFRLFPLSYIMKEVFKSKYVMTYFHIEDFVKDYSLFISKDEFEEYYKISGSLKNRFLRYIKENIGKKNAFVKFKKLTDSVDFINLDQADKKTNWEEAPSVIL